MSEPTPLFRPEAVQHHRQRDARADILHVDETTTSWSYRLVLAALVVVLAFLVVGKLTEYASGPAVLRLDGRTMLTARQAATVSSVAVTPGDHVEAGDLLVQFHSAGETAELDAISREFEDQLAKLLLYPDDAAARESLVSLRTRRELATERLAQLSLRAPTAGTVGDVRVRPGQLVEAGMSVVEVVEPSSRAHVIALLPGRYGPHLHEGQRLRFELAGFARRAVDLEIQHVAEEIVGPSEAARYLGRDTADALPLDGPVVVVEADLADTTFEVDGETYAYAHGMVGKAESPVRVEPLVFAFLPALEPWMERMGLMTGLTTSGSTKVSAATLDATGARIAATRPVPGDAR